MDAGSLVGLVESRTSRKNVSEEETFCSARVESGAQAASKAPNIGHWSGLVWSKNSVYGGWGMGDSIIIMCVVCVFFALFRH